ncbi:hypothetical protein HDA39_003131 [Kribbella italica]|uniref:Uncharacterized protein n=1 Tax=Kribbella italica TaxID=1540520 RepID=A0A7W9J781_9ACTN|nr:hypothetical protein [Kribbella italica]
MLTALTHPEVVERLVVGEAAPAKPLRRTAARRSRDRECPAPVPRLRRPHHGDAPAIEPIHDRDRHRADPASHNYLDRCPALQTNW